MSDTIDPASEHFLLRVGVDNFLRMASLLLEAFDGELLTAVVFLAVSQASVSHLNNGVRVALPGPDGVAPDHMRRPVSVSAVAASLDLPYETVRRHVVKLVEQGLLTRDGLRGVYVPSAAFETESLRRLASGNAASLRLMQAVIARSGMARPDTSAGK